MDSDARKTPYFLMHSRHGRIPLQWQPSSHGSSVERSTSEGDAAHVGAFDAQNDGMSQPKSPIDIAVVPGERNVSVCATICEHSCLAVNSKESEETVSMNEPLDPKDYVRCIVDKLIDDAPFEVLEDLFKPSIMLDSCDGPMHSVDEVVHYFQRHKNRFGVGQAKIDLRTLTLVSKSASSIDAPPSNAISSGFTTESSVQQCCLKNESAVSSSTKKLFHFVPHCPWKQLHQQPTLYWKLQCLCQRKSATVSPFLHMKFRMGGT